VAVQVVLELLLQVLGLWVVLVLVEEEMLLVHQLPVVLQAVFLTQVRLRLQQSA
jgi:hypothetical protein